MDIIIKKLKKSKVWMFLREKLCNHISLFWVWWLHPNLPDFIGENNSTRKVNKFGASSRFSRERIFKKRITEAARKLSAKLNTLGRKWSREDKESRLAVNTTCACDYCLSLERTPCEMCGNSWSSCYCDYDEFVEVDYDRDDDDSYEYAPNFASDAGGWTYVGRR